MAWHTVQETLKLTGKSRSQLYRDMAKGLVSYRTGKNDRREFETSELIRAYGELRTSETPKRHKEGHSKSVVSQAENLSARRHSAETGRSAADCYPNA